ncbi:arsenate reductase (glutaredoxin) [Granulosicoccaceae sp. 1_MG-2023]|nr:arsenate reductase (glutaredoxin) [Granulosicoccaceae sp. 1_MG-2023]
MSDLTILHNPRCSKSRATKQLLDENGADYTTVEYLKDTPSREQLENILKLLGYAPRELMRKGEAVYKEKNLSDESLTDDQLIDAMLENPILIERPIVVHGDRAVIGRPPENVLELLK